MRNCYAWRRYHAHMQENRIRLVTGIRIPKQIMLYSRDAVSEWPGSHKGYIIHSAYAEISYAYSTKLNTIWGVSIGWRRHAVNIILIYTVAEALAKAGRCQNTVSKTKHTLLAVTLEKIVLKVNSSLGAYHVIQAAKQDIPARGVRYGFQHKGCTTY